MTRQHRVVTANVAQMSWDPVGAPRGAVSALLDLVEIGTTLAGAATSAVVVHSDTGLSVVADDAFPTDLVDSPVLRSVASCDELVVLDIAEVAGDGPDALLEAGFVSLAAVPLASSDGEGVGSFCVFATERREWSAPELSGLAALGRQVETSFDRHEEQYHLRDLSIRLAESERAVTVRSEQLARSNRDLEQFAFFAAHELQSPLRAVNAFATVLADLVARPGSVDHEVLVEAANRVDHETERMAAQVQGLMSLARLGDVSVDAVPVALDEVLAVVADRLAPLVDEAAADLCIEPLPDVVGDPAGLEVVFMNLVSNAIRYRDPERPLRVVVSGRAGDDGALVDVADNGVGISSDDLARVFEAFQRVDTNVVGAGIGLTLTRRLLEIMGGSISATSSGGEGTTFTVRLDRPGGAAQPA